MSRYFAIRKEYNRLLDELKPDVVHVNGCWMPQDAWTAVWAKQMGLRGRKFTIEHFASDIVAKQMVDVYRKVIS